VTVSAFFNKCSFAQASHVVHSCSLLNQYQRIPSRRRWLASAVFELCFKIYLQVLPKSSKLLYYGWLPGSPVGIGLAISIPLIIVALTVDNIGRFYNRVISSYERSTSHLAEVHPYSEFKNWKTGLHRRLKVRGEDNGEPGTPVVTADGQGSQNIAESNETEVPKMKVPKMRQRTVSWNVPVSQDLEKGRDKERQSAQVVL